MSRYAKVVAGVVCVVLVAVAALVVGMHLGASSARPHTAAASDVSTPIDPQRRDLAVHKSAVSVIMAKRHARATERRRAAARRAREAAGQAAARRVLARQDQGSGGPGPDTPAERACVGHEDEYPCSVIEQRDVGDHYQPTYAERCPDGAASGPRCSTESSRRWANDQAEWARRHHP